MRQDKSQEHRESGPFPLQQPLRLLLPVTVIGQSGLDGTLPSPLENLSWGLLIKLSTRVWTTDPSPGLYLELALPVTGSHMHIEKQQKVTVTVSECGPNSDPETRAQLARRYL